ncbi:hypothetical protein [Salinivibrio proteolyticus]|uniref:Uncharacterized protein n=1 Tax=Salinivibrio proteolyticus TaxID=334715 RepID=A0ABY7LL80_9GAMM|nr:hypothetical protein [Salinivibrio proteolyticus]WBA16418.1 hypothetical protein N7E60_16945 [Salinivibrio proteolyticus]
MESLNNQSNAQRRQKVDGGGEFNVFQPLEEDKPAPPPEPDNFGDKPKVDANALKGL